MEIIVNGIGSKYVTPDLVTMDINFSLVDKSYENAIANGPKTVIEFIDKVLLENNIEKDKMKTRSFIVSEEKEYNEEKREYILVGYKFSENAHITLDYDLDLISKIIINLKDLKNAPSITFDFKVKNEEKIRESVLSLAYNDALSKARTIATASGSEIKCCKKVTFNNESTDYAYTPRLYNCSISEDIKNTFTPEDIEIKEILYCTFETN